ncbi:MAG: YfgM family protein [Gammaproteobacteria bacterium]
MEGYSTDSEQIDALRNWWKKNGRYVVTGLVVAAIVVGGWRLWGYWQARRASAAAGLYAAVVIAEQKNDNAAIAKGARTLIGQYPDTAYGALAGLALAKAEFAQQHFTDAEQALRNVMQDSPDKGIATVAQLRLASIQIQHADAKAALTTLNGAIPPAFASTADTLRGEALLALGRKAEARAVWQRALAASDPQSGSHQLLAMRIASLPAAATATMAVTVAKPIAAGAAATANAGSALTTTSGAAATGGTR